ncbi:dimethylaniline monooxygenase [N-oxide-forming] 4 isoform X3 [Leptonychotes weddellii]|uniref:Flavin-containing monooxygenase n=1 Tax=Leptonychotes weddellii TaxID=9713 RepID=A0A7F8R1A8_LEPWE|nr:dimethylaniline monooxygenase [N-oxide-forming] 4 isoform X3 [Leptonychotes weddellii]XP_030887160.1 dimethylaniline monooxygenase [N-oxide-forming] 4 isoform X3 [Leptonychotes weddellii]
MARRVAVIGAGVSGLSSIKCCLDEDLEPTCFERSNDIGGLWKFTTTVCSIMKRPDFSETGQWDVVTETEGKQERAVFDAVMVCTGHYLNPRLPLESFPGLCKIPPSQKLMAEATKKEQLIERGVMKDTSEDKLEFILYLDDLAACIGAKPSIPLLFLKDPRLAWEVFFGPCTPYQYRLMGPGKWDGARNAILTQWDRTLKPLKTRIIPDSTKPASMSHYLKVWGAPILLASLLLICKSSFFLKSAPDNLQDRISPYLVSIW